VRSFPFPTARPPALWLDDAIPVFAPRPEHHRAHDRYDRDNAAADLYTGIAYGHHLWHDGSAEPLYRTLAALVLGAPAGPVLDAGCGVGRVLYDCAPARPGVPFCGVDLAYQNCRRAHAILRAGQPLPLDAWAHRGRPGAILFETKTLDNVFIAQANAQALPFDSGTFATLCSALVLCQVADPAQALAEFVRVLRPGGRLVLATPFAFRQAEAWQPPWDLRAALDTFGVQVEEWFDGLPYREVLDARGNAHEWRVTVLSGRVP